MNINNLIDYYNKFNEDKRITHRHTIVEYTTAMKYIHEYLYKINKPKILDVGAGTGAYSIKLANEGYDVTAVELIKNPEADLLDIIKAPDFSTGGVLLYDREQLKNIYDTGRGSFKVRARYSFNKKVFLGNVEILCDCVT